jgi:hypothetical protein
MTRMAYESYLFGGGVHHVRGLVQRGVGEAQVAGAPSRHVSAASCCIVHVICVSCNPLHTKHRCTLSNVVWPLCNA